MPTVFKKLPAGKSLKDIHNWWDYGINPVTGWNDKRYEKADPKKYHRNYIIEKQTKK